MITLEEIIELMINIKVLKVKREKLNIKSCLEEAGIDSLDMMMFMFEINKKYSKNLKLTKKNSLEEVLSMLNAENSNV
jgi:acyl carrier protein